MKQRAALMGIGLVLTVTAAWAGTRLNDGFPHDRHQGIFPLCSGCHAGIENGNPTQLYPDPPSCANCHDGTTESRIDWSGPIREPSNLNFDHPNHVRLVESTADSLTCASCHQEVGRSERMAVGRARPESCVGCHAHESPEHIAEAANCVTCHIPITAASELSIERVSNFPEPSTHQNVDFLVNHGRNLSASAETCAVCHARDSCERCHLNASAVPSISTLGPDDRVAMITQNEPAEYPVPPSHQRADWLWEHAVTATDGLVSCANCHAQSSCLVCHQTAQLSEIEALPRPASHGPQGVVFEGDGPDVHPVGFSLAHSTQAAAASQSCLSCHEEQTFCLNCHEGPNSPSFHVGNFRERHGALAYGGAAECSTCHNTEVFCRACHAGNGLASEGRLNVAFHTSQPFWLLGHGQAARRDLQSCTTCHAQTDCQQCHSSVGAWRVNPHGPGFDPNQTQDANRLTCFQCHRNDQLDSR